MEFERKELQKIRMRAWKAAEEFEINTSWKRAYLRLSDAANTLDALIARSEEERSRMDVSSEKENKEKEKY